MVAQRSHQSRIKGFRLVQGASPLQDRDDVLWVIWHSIHRNVPDFSCSVVLDMFSYCEFHHLILTLGKLESWRLAYFVTCLFSWRSINQCLLGFFHQNTRSITFELFLFNRTHWCWPMNIDGIAAATVGSIINYLLLGLGIQVDRFYLHSFEILLACTVVFPGVGNLGYTLLEYRIGHRSFFGALVENLRWIPFLWVLIPFMTFHIAHLGPYLVILVLSIAFSSLGASVFIYPRLCLRTCSRTICKHSACFS